MIYDITVFGAKPESGKLQTDAIQQAADHCRDSGGGTVNIPPGTFATGTIRLYSNTILHLEPGAVLQGPDSFDGYPAIPFGWDLYPSTHSLIYAMDAENISITGGGTINFNGKVFVDWNNLSTDLPEEKQSQLTPKLRASCHYTMPPRDQRPNRLIFFHNCRNIELSRVTFCDSPTWAIVFSSCRFVRVCHVNIDNHMQVPNSDGIHCCGCKDVLISGCFISAGDDCIAITGIADFNCISERIIITDCVFRSASAAVRIGFLASKIRDIQLSNLIIHDSNRGIAIFAGEGGSVDNVSIDNVSIETRIYAGPWWGKGEPLVICAASPMATISSISVRNITAKAENSVIVTGGQNITLKDWTMTLRYGEARPLYGSDLDLAPHPGRPAPDATQSIPWLNAEHIKNLITENIKVKCAADEPHVFETTAVIK